MFQDIQIVGMPFSSGALVIRSHWEIPTPKRHRSSAYYKPAQTTLNTRPQLHINNKPDYTFLLAHNVLSATSLPHRNPPFVQYPINMVAFTPIHPYVPLFQLPPVSLLWLFLQSNLRGPCIRVVGGKIQIREDIEFSSNRKLAEAQSRRWKETKRHYNDYKAVMMRPNRERNL
jgi:hypothetical protein